MTPVTIPDSPLVRLGLALVALAAGAAAVVVVAVLGTSVLG
jgi:hypothetical protein